MEEPKKPEEDYNQNDFLAQSDRKIQKKSLTKWYKIIISIVLGLFFIHLIFKYSDSSESEYKGKRYYIENVVCKKDSTVTFNFNQKIMNRTVRFINESNVKELIITIDYFPSRRIEVLDFDEAKKKTPGGYHWNESVNLKTDRGFYLTSTKNCRMTARLKN